MAVWRRLYDANEAAGLAQRRPDEFVDDMLNDGDFLAVGEFLNGDCRLF